MADEPAAPAAPAAPVTPAAPAAAPAPATPTGPTIIPATPAAPATPADPSAGFSLDKLLSGEMFTALKEKGYKTAADLGKGYLELETKIGAARTVVPKEGDPQASWDAFWTAAGRPEAADKYTLPELPAGVAKDEGLEAWLRETSFKAGHNQQQTDMFYNSWAEFQQARAAEIKTATDEVTEQLKAEWGPKWDANVDAGKYAIAVGAGTDAQAVMHLKLADGSYLMDNPVIARMMSGLGHKLGEAGLEPPGTTAIGGITTPAGAKAEIGRLKADPEFGKAFMTKSHPEHGAAVEKMNRLNALAAS